MSTKWHWHIARTVQHLHDERGAGVAQVSMPSPKKWPLEAEFKSHYATAAELIASAPTLREALRTIERRAAACDCGCCKLAARTARGAQAN